MKKFPHKITLPKSGVPSIGYICVAENSDLPLTPKLICHTSEEVKKGGHSHVELRQILIKFPGKIFLKVEALAVEIFESKLDYS